MEGGRERKVFLNKLLGVLPTIPTQYYNNHEFLCFIALHYQVFMKFRTTAMLCQMLGGGDMGEHVGWGGGIKHEECIGLLCLEMGMGEVT